MVLVSQETNGIFAKNGFPLFEVKINFGNHHLIGIESNRLVFDFLGFAKGSFIKNSVTNHFRIFNERQVDGGILIDAIRKGCNGPFGREHAYTFTRNTKDSRKFLESETNLNIVDNEGDGDRFIKISNETDTFVELKDKHGTNLLSMRQSNLIAMKVW
ncbi:hypothetical protein Tco_0956631 [Tanacetum coccineum]